jgi:soluble lytic murein transglycosylase-like protein
MVSRRFRRFPLGGAKLCWALALAVGVAHADIYQHVDSNGVIVFQNKKKQGKLVARERPSRVVMPSAGGETSRYDAHIREAAALYQIPEALVRAVIKVESNFDPRALSPANAHGLMQLIPETAARMMVTDIYDPRQNIMGGVRYLRVLANLFNGNLELTIAGYNAGENAVMKYGGIPPYRETQQYVVKVLSAYAQYRRIAQPG